MVDVCVAVVLHPCMVPYLHWLVCVYGTHTCYQSSKYIRIDSRRNSSCSTSNTDLNIDSHASDITPQH